MTLEIRRQNRPWCSQLYDRFSSVPSFCVLEKTLNELRIVVIADHSISHAKANKALVGVWLDESLDSFHIVGAGEAWSTGHQIKACPNLRATHYIFGILPFIHLLLDSQR
jgi:hypothetical protein